MATDLRAKLYARALRWLAQREQSRGELRTRLLQAARPEAADAARDPQAQQAAAGLVDAVLDQLQAQGYLSEARFIESRLHARQAVWGARRIRHELRQHGLALNEQQQLQLQATERERAQALWARRYGTVTTDAAERARQMRFLAARGFSTDAIRHAVAGLDDDAFGPEPQDP